MDILTLSAGDLQLEILLALGGAVTRFTAGEFPVFRATPPEPASVSDTASFPLIPFSNRIRAGHFTFSGTGYQLALDKRDPRFTNHGHSRHLPWQLVDAGPSHAHLRFTHAAPGPAWPFPFTAEQIFELAPGQLTMQARLRNDHAGPAPAGIGFHPYFTRQPGTKLQFTAACRWESDALDISVSTATPAGRFDFAAPRPLETQPINHAYGGWTGRAEITHPTGPQITLRATPALNHLILFTPEAKSFFGFEPVSHRPDAVNPLPDPQDQGMEILPPGAWLEGRVTIGITR